MKRPGLWLGALLWAWVALAACNKTTGLTIDVGGACDAPKALKEHLATQSTKKVYGCLVMFWQTQPKTRTYSHAVKLDGDGKIDLVDANENKGISIPVSGTRHPYLVRIYLIHPKKAESIADDAPGQQVLCQTMGASNYDCFANPRECWMGFMITPTVPSSDSSTKIYDLDADGGRKCIACTLEVCDGVDNDCNGKVDEFDLLNNKPCPAKP